MIRRAIRTLVRHPAAPVIAAVAAVRTTEDLVEAKIAQPRLNAWILAIFAAVSILLSIIGAAAICSASCCAKRSSSPPAHASPAASPRGAHRSRGGTALMTLNRRAPHPAFGHLLPASGAKGYLPPLPLAPLAGRGWREAPGEGR